jgi:hypothetical protein
MEYGMIKIMEFMEWNWNSSTPLEGILASIIRIWNMQIKTPIFIISIIIYIYICIQQLFIFIFYHNIRIRKSLVIRIRNTVRPIYCQNNTLGKETRTSPIYCRNTYNTLGKETWTSFCCLFVRRVNKKLKCLQSIRKVS